MDHFGFFPIQALIYILNQTRAPFLSAWSLLMALDLPFIFTSRNTCPSELFMSLGMLDLHHGV